MIYGEDNYLTCEKCGHEWVQTPTKSYEDSDADGNRGRWMYCVICPQCNEEGCWYGGY